MKKLIVGKNSNIARTLEANLSRDQFDLISHAELDEVDFSLYSQVFLFSWSQNSYQENTRLIEQIPPNKLTFISSVAVFALHVRKQWSNYPNWKFKCEKLVRERGGKIVRIGILQPEVIEKINGWYFHTDYNHILELLKSEKYSDLKNLFEIRYHARSKNGYIEKLSEYFYRQHHHFTGDLAVIDKVFSFILRCFGRVSYSYTHDCNLLACNTLQIGYGALGSEIKESVRNTICVSNVTNKTLNEDGFSGTRIGFDKTGLGKFWHGAYIYKSGNDLCKGVLFPVRRPKLPRGTLRAHVEKISWIDENNSFRIKIASDIEDLEIQSKSLVIAAGILETGRLILPMIPQTEELLFDDHDIGYIGSVVTKELVQKKIITRWGPFIQSRRVVKLFDQSDIECLIDFRPFVKEKLSSDPSFYNKPTFQIIIDMLKKFNAYRINEAIFNRFGFSFYTRKSSVFMQALNRECISLRSKELCRKNTFEKTEIIIAAIKKEITSFVPLDHWTIIDGQHIYPSNVGSILRFIESQPFSSQIKLIGYYKSYKLSSSHHTFDLQKITRKEII